MRPSLLDPLFAALTVLPGTGPKFEKLYRRLFDRGEDLALNRGRRMTSPGLPLNSYARHGVAAVRSRSAVPSTITS